MSRDLRDEIGTTLALIVEFYGLILLLLMPVLIVFGQSAGDAIAFGICGLGLVTWTRRR